MKFTNDAQIRQAVDICKKYEGLKIYACCEENEYVVDGKSLGAMRLLKNGGEIYFKAAGEDEEVARFVEEIAEETR